MEYGIRFAVEHDFQITDMRRYWYMLLPAFFTVNDKEDVLLHKQGQKN